MKRFTAKDVEEMFGIRRNRLRHWVESGIVIPSIQKGDGPGIHHVYNKEDMVKIAFVDALIKSGFHSSWGGMAVSTQFEWRGNLINVSVDLTRLERFVRKLLNTHSA